MTGPTALQAVLFDMDGTLVDTEVLWWQAAKEEAARLGYLVSDADAPDVLGQAVGHTAAHLHRVTGGKQPAGLIGERLDARFTALVSTGPRPLPGALALLDALAAEGVPIGLVSASPRSVVDLVLRHLESGTPADGRFAVSVAAGETPRTKPAPDPYLAAARMLCAAPGNCVVVEDSPTGVASAEAAGCRVLAVPSLTPIPPAPGRSVLRSLVDAEPALLHTLAARRG